MNQLSFFIDGMLSGTGVRDATNGGYLEPQLVGLSDSLQQRISIWLSDYENTHFCGYNDKAQVEALDKEGLRIVQLARDELPYAKIRYFSNAYMQEIIL